MGVAAAKTIYISGRHQSEEDRGKSIGLSYRFRGVPNARTERVPSARTPGYRLPEPGGTKHPWITSLDPQAFR